MKTVGIALAMSLALACWGCGGASRLDSVPGELTGVWYSNHPNYAGRYFELRPRMVIFGTGEDSNTQHEIVSIQRTVEDQQTVYEVTYRNEGAEDTWTFFYYSDHSIQFKNQLGVPWSKDLPGSGEASGEAPPGEAEAGGNRMQ
jgi:hypothetical protein